MLGDTDMDKSKSLLVSLINNISNIDCFQKKSVERFFSQLTEVQFKQVEEFADDYLLALLDKGYSLEEMAEDYSWMCREILKEQIYFKRKKHYRYNRIDDVIDKVYNNKTYMKRYMIGVGISQILWENHNLMYKFWLQHLSKSKGKTYLEIGIGHGWFFTSAVKNSGFEEYVGVDISETSLSMTRDLLDRMGTNLKYELILNDIMELTQYDNSIDFVCMGEVLEHVEKPQLLIDKIASMMKRGGKAYISTCANAPVIDHIYLFNNIEEIRELFYTANLRIMDEIIVCNDNTPKDLWEQKKANLSYAAIVER